MSEAKHTPGEWRATGASVYADGQVEPEVAITYGRDGAANANARLIAAAPDMLAALRAIKVRLHFVGMPQETMWKGGPDWRKEIAALEAAIAKATS